MSELARLRLIRAQASRDLVAIVRRREQEQMDALALQSGTDVFSKDCAGCGRPLEGKRLHEANTDRMCPACRPSRGQNTKRAEGAP